MKEYSKTKEVLNRIKALKDVYLLSDFIEHNIPVELLNDTTFVQRMIQANPLVPHALEILNGQINIQSEIDDLGLEAVIADDSNLKRIPPKYKEQLFDIATSYEEVGDYEKSKRIYKAITRMGQGQIYKFNARYGNMHDNRDTLYYKSKYSYYICKIKNGEELSPEDKADLDSLIKEDKNNILNLKTPGKLSDFDIFSSYFTEISIEQLKGEILPSLPTGQKKSPPNFINPTPDREYIPELSPQKRIEFILDNFNITDGKVKLGKAQLLGYIIFEPANSDVSIVEKFYDTKGKGTDNIVPSYGGATYILHKDVELDLEQLSSSQLSAKKKSDEKGLIDSVAHYGKKYYTYLLQRFSAVEEAGKKLHQETPSAFLDNTDLRNPNTVAIDTVNQSSPNEAESFTDGIPESPDTEQVEEDLSSDETQPSRSNLSDLLDIIQSLDAEYEEIKKQQESINAQSQEISQRLDQLRKQSAQRIDGMLTPEVVAIIKEELKTIQDFQIALGKLDSLKSSIKEQEAKNRQERNNLSNEYKDRLIKGES